MSWARFLYELQEIELELEEKEKALAQVESELKNDAKLKAAQEELRRQEEYLSRLQKEQRSGEWDLEDLKLKIKQVEKKLYGGKVTNPKELMSLQQDIEQHKGQYRKKEDELLEIMEKVEEAQLILEEKRKLLKEAESDWAKRCQELSQRREELLEAISLLRQKQEQQLSFLDNERLSLYQQLRQGNRGVVVAKVEAGRCENCRLSLSLAEIQRARSKPIFCSSCRCLLYAP